MKRMAFSIVLAVFAVAVCIFGYCNTARSANTLIVSAENIDRLLSDGEAEKALEKSRKLQADWEKIHDKLCVFLPHEHLEPLENIFAVLPYYIEQEEVSLARACEKRPVPLETLERIVDEIETLLQNSLDREVPSTLIGTYAMDKLKKVDEVAYVRFASVYREFKDINTFMDELNKIKAERNR